LEGKTVVEEYKGKDYISRGDIENHKKANQSIKKKTEEGQKKDGCVKKRGLEKRCEREK